MVFGILTISCLTLLDSATAMVIDPNQESNSENIDSVDEENIEQTSTYSTFQNKNNKNETVKRNITISNNEISQSDNKTDEKDSNNNTENTSQYKNMNIPNFNTVKAANNVTNDSSINQNSVATDDNVVDPIAKSYDTKMQYIGIIVFVVCLIISFSSFILYLKS